jgi:hypothetical protein
MEGKMSPHAANIAISEQKILKLLVSHHGQIVLSRLLSEMKKAGLDDETLIRSAIWNLISDARIERDADTILLVRP